MPGLIIGNKQFEIPGLKIQNWFDNPKMRLKMGGNGDGYVRGNKGWIVRNMCFHTTQGKHPVIVNPGVGPDYKMDEIITRSWTGSTRQAGAHIVIDFDGTVVCCSDLLLDATYHATSVNGHSIGYEICQGKTGNTWEIQYEVALRIQDALTLRFGVQRLFQDPYEINAIPRIRSGAMDVVGAYCHYHQTRSRGLGDCGSHMFERMRSAGYMPVDYSKGADLELGERTQEQLGLKGDDVDGAIGPGTVRLLKAAGHKYGQLVARPNDDLDARIFGVAA